MIEKMKERKQRKERTGKKKKTLMMAAAAAATSEREQKKDKELVSELQKPKARADLMVPSDTRGL